MKAKTVVKILAFLAIAAGAWSLFSSAQVPGSQQVKNNKLPQVRVIRVVKKRMVESLETTGDVIATNTVTLSATIEGPISYCPWREGDMIDAADEKLLTIDRPIYLREVEAAQGALNVAQAKLTDLKAGTRPEVIAQAREVVRRIEKSASFAKADLDRIASLVDSGALPTEEVEKAQVRRVKEETDLIAARERLHMMEAGPTATEVAVAEAEVGVAAARLTLAQSKLAECTLVAPFAGVVTEVYVRSGDLATPRIPLLKLMDPKSLIVRAGLPESSAQAIRKGTACTIQLDAYPGQRFTGVIERIHPRIEFNSRTRIVEARITDTVKLIPRMFARLTVQGKIFDHALTVPDQAIITTPRGHHIVYVVTDGVARSRRVILGLEQGQDVQILEGLVAGEVVVVAGNFNLENGKKVNVVDAASERRVKYSQAGAIK